VLIADGATNKEIAQKLVVSEKHGAEPRESHPRQARLQQAVGGGGVCGEEGACEGRVSANETVTTAL
jgi:hypothetical protein